MATKSIHATPKLKAFLKKRKVWTKFKRNCRGSTYQFSNMSGAFLWDNTPEGHRFWCSLEGEYLHE